MAHPHKHAAHKSDPKWLNGVRKYEDGGEVSNDSAQPGDDELFQMADRALHRQTPNIPDQNYHGQLNPKLEPIPNYDPSQPKRYQPLARGGNIRKGK